MVENGLLKSKFCKVNNIFKAVYLYIKWIYGAHVYFMYIHLM